MTDRILPLPEFGGPVAGTVPPGADLLPLAGGPAGFRLARVVRRGADGAAEYGPPEPAASLDLPCWPGLRRRITARRQPWCGLALDAPVLMGIVNATPDSFHAGSRAADAEAAALRGLRMVEAGAGLVDFGGESTRPGARPVPVAEEMRRVLPAIRRFRELAPQVPVSIDTRRAEVARQALAAGARMVNDVSGLCADPAMPAVIGDSDAVVCVMHAQGEPAVMQRDPRYRSALLDVHAWLAARVAALVAGGIPRHRIAVDPGIGFGKTPAHSLELLAGLALFHDIGCPLLVGASRKRFLAGFRDGAHAAGRLPGSLAAALQAVAAGAQILRVHDVAETAQAVQLWQALHHRRGG